MAHLELQINGRDYAVEVDPRITLLDLLREQAKLTGTKKGCDHGQCGACTVHVNGERILSCMTFAIEHRHHDVTTIEGLAAGDGLHPLQTAFVECDGFQCGYCTPGQIMSAAAMLRESAHQVPSYVTPDVSRPPGLEQLSDMEIRERMSGNLCRCGAYPNIVDAVRQVLRQEEAK